MSVGVALLKAKASDNIPILNYSYRIYHDGSPQSGHLHYTTVVRARHAHVLVSTKPSVHRRLLQIPFHGLSNILVARVRCSRINNVSSLHNFYICNSVGVCNSRVAARALPRAVPCYFPGSTRGLCPNTPGLGLRAVMPRRSCRVKSINFVPVQIVRSRLPVLKCHFKGFTCVASVGSVDSRRCTCLSNMRALIVGTLHFSGPRRDRRLITSTVHISHEVKTGRACLARIARRVKLRSTTGTRLPTNFYFTCSNLRLRVSRRWILVGLGRVGGRGVWNWEVLEGDVFFEGDL